MSIQSHLDRLSSNISESYTACSDMGATLPDEQVSDNLPTTIRSIPKGGGGGVQEIFYADFDVDLSTFTVTGISTTYQEMVSQIEAGKYIVGRGIYAMVSSPINMAYFPLSTDLRERGTLIFSGLLRSSFANQDVILSITVTIDSSNEVYVQARLVSTTDIN